MSFTKSRFFKQQLLIYVRFTETFLITCSLINKQTKKSVTRYTCTYEPRTLFKQTAITLQGFASIVRESREYIVSLISSN